MPTIKIDLEDIHYKAITDTLLYGYAVIDTKIIMERILREIKSLSESYSSETDK